MLGWYKLLHGLCNDLPLVARIIQQQNPNSLKWATDRLREFVRILACDYELVPGRTPDGLDWTGSDDKDEDDLIFFDHLYNMAPDDAYYTETPIYLRVGLQCNEGKHPVSLIEAKLGFEMIDDDEMYICSGEITLTGQRGVWWNLRVRLHCKDESLRQELVELFDPHVEFVSPYPGTSYEYQDAHSSYRVSAAQAMNIFHKMANFLKAKQG